MNGLVLCTPAHKQPETSAVVPVLDRWVRRTQGDTARDRAERSGLLWAVTMFNARVTDMLQKQDKWHQEWKGLNDIAFKIYESLEFMRDWRGGRPFSNTFMVRTRLIPISRSSRVTRKWECRPTRRKSWV